MPGTVPTRDEVVAAAIAWRDAWRTAEATAKPGALAVHVKSDLIVDRVSKCLKSLVDALGQVLLEDHHPEGLSDAAFRLARDSFSARNAGKSRASRAMDFLGEVYFGLDGLLERRPSGRKGLSVQDPTLYTLLESQEGLRRFREDPHLEVFDLIISAMYREELAESNESKKSVVPLTTPQIVPSTNAKPAAIRKGRIQRSKVFVALRNVEYFVSALESGRLDEGLRPDLGLLLLRETTKYPEWWRHADNVQLECLPIRGCQGKTLGDWLATIGQLPEFERVDDGLNRQFASRPDPNPRGDWSLDSRWVVNTLIDHGWQPSFENALHPVNSLEASLKRARRRLQAWIAGINLQLREEL